MKTRFFFPVVTMIAFATVTNAAALKLGVNEPGVEVASVEKVDARAGAETSVLGARLSGLTSGFECGAEVARRMDAGAETSVCGTKQSGLMSGYACGAEVARRMDAGAKTSVCGEKQSGLTSIIRLASGAEKGIQFVAGMYGRIEI
ncbi:MAG: hypothetical protein MJZ14_05390 [Paludibacteraceae bacterium]|nr:hypothetical protein [Paludibacteraceae bacterium]